MISTGTVVGQLGPYFICYSKQLENQTEYGENCQHDGKQEAQDCDCEGKKNKGVNPTTIAFFLEARSGPGHRERESSTARPFVNRGDKDWSLGRPSSRRLPGQTTRQEEGACGSPDSYMGSAESAADTQLCKCRVKFYKTKYKVIGEL